MSPHRSIAAVFALMSAAAAGAQDAKPAIPTPPPYTPVRWNENYSYLKDESARKDFFDPIKYIPLGSEDVYLSFGGQVRERYEYFNNNNFDAGPQDDDGFLLSRVLLHADLHVTKYFRFFVQGKGAFLYDRDGGARPIDVDYPELQQGFFDVKIPFGEKKDSFTFRAGRQDLLYGAQRLISPLDWANTRRTFDGLKGSLVLGDHTIDAFYVEPVLVDKYGWNESDDDTEFAGIYDTILLPNVLEGAGTKLEIYGLWLGKDTNATTPVDSDRYTIGARFSAAPKPWDFDVEGDYQFGENGSGDISAYSLAVEGGYTFADLTLSPRVYLGFDYASGDDDPTDSDNETFNQLFPLGHAYFGYIDVIGRQNIIDLHPGIELSLAANKKYAKKVTLRGDYHLFWRAEEEDGLYNAAGAQFRPAGGSDESYVGSELDLLLNWQIDRHWNAYVGYSHFFAGAFIDDGAADDDIDFLYGAVTFTF